MAEYNLRSAHVSCLYHLYTEKCLTATELCRKCAEDKATISRAIEYLESEQYLKCESKRAKRYKSPIVLTEKGMEVGEKIAERIDKALSEISFGLTEEERASFYRSLSIIHNNIEAVAVKAGK